MPCAHVKKHMIVIMGVYRNSVLRYRPTKKQARVLRACLNSNGLTSGDDANGDGSGGANGLRSSNPSSFPGPQRRWRDLPTTAPGLAGPERQEPTPHQLQRGTELSSSSLISPFGDRTACQRATRQTELVTRRSADRMLEGATSIGGE
jgi:hypothetical protein